MKKKIVPINTVTIEKEKWFLAVSRNMSFWHECLLAKGWFSNMKDFGVNFRLRTLSLTVQGTRTSLFCTNPNYEEYKKELLRVYASAPLLARLRKRYITLGKVLLAATDACNVGLSPKTLQDFLNAYQVYTAGLQITAAFGTYATELLVEKLLKLGYSKNETDNVVAVSTYPVEVTPLFGSQIDLLKLGIKIQKIKNKKVEEKGLKVWLARYGNIPVNYCEEPWTMEDARKQLQQILTKNCARELKIVKATRRTKIAEKKAILKKINNKEITTLAEALSTAAFLNEYRKNIFSTVSLRFRKFFAEIAEKAGSNNWRHCFNLSPEEMMEIVHGKKIPLRQFVFIRRVVGMSTTKYGRLEYLTNAEVRRVFSFVQKIYGQRKEAGQSGQTVVSGISANRGKVSGIVKVVLDSKDFAKFKQGNILVTTMTSVDFVPLMEKAAAFVTNEGAITSHAAIMSREMNKPCILATKIATRVFKDGDLVEVDANNGIVRKL